MPGPPTSPRKEGGASSEAPGSEISRALTLSGAFVSDWNEGGEPPEPRICCAELGRGFGGELGRLNSTAECGRGEVERLGDTLRSPGMRRSTGVGVPPRGVRPKNIGGWGEVAGFSTLGGTKRRPFKSLSSSLTCCPSCAAESSSASEDAKRTGCGHFLVCNLDQTGMISGNPELGGANFLGTTTMISKEPSRG